MNDFDVMTVLHAATKILAVRLLTLLCLTMTFGLACWAMILQTPLSSGIAAGFAALVFLPVLARDSRQGD